MPSYEIVIGAQTVTVVQAGANNASTRRAAFNVALVQIGASTARGIHGHMTPDGVDANGVIITIPDGQHGGTWIETPAARVRPVQAQQAQAGNA